MIAWKKDYSCFNKDIDLQHQKLFALLDEFYSIVNVIREGHDQYDNLVQIFDELSKYTIYHFRFEEGIFTNPENGYSAEKIKVHKNQHQFFIDKIAEVDFASMDDDQRYYAIEFVLFLAKWIEEHILTIDKKFFTAWQEKQQKETTV